MIHINLFKLCNYKLKFTFAQRNNSSALKTQRNFSFICSCKPKFFLAIGKTSLCMETHRYLPEKPGLSQKRLVYHSFVPLAYHMGVRTIRLFYHNFDPFACHTYDITCVLVLSRAILMISHECVNDSVGLLQFWSFRVPCL